jgi:hypothetical protein
VLFCFLLLLWLLGFLIGLLLQKEQGIEDREEEIRNIRQQLEETSNNMSKTGAQIRQHEHNAVYEEKAKEAEADNIVNYEEDTLKQNAPIKTRLVRKFLSSLAGVKVSYSGSHTTVYYKDPATGTTTTIKSGPLSGAAHEHILIDNVLKIAKALNLSKSTLKNKFDVTVLSSPKKPETPLDTIPTPNKEVVVVQMGDNQEAIATRKRMVERIKQDPSNKVYVVKAESTSDTQLPIEGNIKQLAGEYEINIIGRSTIKEGNRVIEDKDAKQLVGMLSKIVSIEKGATANDAPILKNISITHCQGSDCSPINNLATSLRKEVAGDIIVKDSLEYHQAKAAEQSNFQKEKQLEADRREQESSAQQQQNQKEQRKALEWELHLGETKSAFVITEEMKERGLMIF